MDERTVMAALERARRQGNDDGTFEAKSCSGGLSKDVWESVSAFANTRGGLLLLGIDERRGFAPAEPFDLDRVRDQFVSGIGDGGRDNARLTNPPHYDLLRVDVGDRQALAILIEELDPRLKPCFITARGVQAGSYKRVDDKDVRLSPTELYELANALIQGGSDARVIPGATYADLDMAAVEDAVSREVRSGSRSMRGTSTLDQRMARLGIADGEGGVRMAGLLALGYFPQQFFPMLCVDVAVHPQAAKSQGGAVRFVDRAVCEGPVGDAIDQAVAAVMRNLRTASVVEGTRRTDVPELPEEVLREAVANAVCHREYSDLFEGQAVAVDVYPDRVEVTSPGGLWGGKTVDNIDDGTSRCRNASLVRLARTLPASHGAGMRVEGQGSGIPMMLYEMGRRGLPAPEFEAGVDYFRVTLRRGRPEPVGRGPRPPAAVRGKDDVLAVLSSEVPMSVREVAEATGAKVDTVRARLRKLVARGEVVPTAPATSRARRYLLAGE